MLAIGIIEAVDAAREFLMVFKELELEVFKLLVDIIPFLDGRDGRFKFILRLTTEVFFAHPVASVGKKLRVEIEAGAGGELHGAQLGGADSEK